MFNYWICIEIESSSFFFSFKHFVPIELQAMPNKPNHFNPRSDLIIFLTACFTILMMLELCSSENLVLDQ